MDNQTKTQAEPAPALGPGPEHHSPPTRQTYRSFAELATAFGVDPEMGRAHEKRDWVDIKPASARE